MKKEVFTYLKTYSFDPTKIDRLIVSSFLRTLKIDSVTNTYIKEFFIRETDKDFKVLKEFLEIQEISSLEQLIELFEFVISPEDKVVNGAVYTPGYIREYIVKQSFVSSNCDLTEAIICDPACGCAGFLYTTAKFLKEQTNRTYKEIFSEQIYGLDIEKYSIKRSQLLLLLLAISEGEDEEYFVFNFHTGNALNFDWRNYITDFNGFDMVLGNPPYVCSRNMDQNSLDLMGKWVVTQSGHPDLYIPFFQFGFENLKPDGILGLITVNTFIKSVNGRSLREYFSSHQVDIKIINFGGEQVFRNRSTYTCICFIRNTVGNVQYKRTVSTSLDCLTDSMFIEFEYASLHDHDGWNLVDTIEQTEYINKIESIGKPLKELYTTRNGIATLKNHIYKFFPISEDTEYYTLKTKADKTYKVEKKICRDIVNPNKARTPEGIESNREKVIFPYVQKKEQTIILQEEVFIEEYPFAYQYLQDHKKALSTRDKGKREYEKWYAYGRRQSLDINAYKLFFPHLSERPSFTISKDKKLLFYSGIAVVSESLKELQVLKRILKSDVFFNYIKNITKDYSSGYISMSKNYIKNFGICNLSEDDKNKLLKSNNPEKLLRQFYQLELSYKAQKPKLANVAESNTIYGK